MNIWVGIPTGQRGDNAEKVCRAWKANGFNIALYSWDGWTTRLCKTIVDKLYEGERKSFAILQNYMANMVPDWDVWICGADDLYPDKGTHLIGLAAEEVPGGVIWADDGLFGQLPTHPIITRQWYDKYGEIFDENFIHNFCDTDLMVRTSEAEELVKCFDIRFDHRHFLKTGKKPDEIYKLGASTFKEDEAYFKEKWAGMLPLKPIHTITME